MTQSKEWISFLLGYCRSEFFLTILHITSILLTNICWTSPRQPCVKNGSPKAAYFNSWDVDTFAFRTLLSHGVPAVVTNVKMWEVGPDYFIKRHGKVMVEIEGCKNGARRRMSVAQFLENFHQPGPISEEDSKSSSKLKVSLSYSFALNAFTIELKGLSTEREFPKGLSEPILCIYGRSSYARHSTSRWSAQSCISPSREWPNARFRQVLALLHATCHLILVSIRSKIIHCRTHIARRSLSWLY